MNIFIVYINFTYSGYINLVYCFDICTNQTFPYQKFHRKCVIHHLNTVSMKY